MFPPAVKFRLLKALNYLINSFSSDIAIIDYRVRGFTRDINGKKLYIDHKINSIQNYIRPDTRELYQMIDVNVYQEKYLPYENDSKKNLIWITIYLEPLKRIATWGKEENQATAKKRNVRNLLPGVIFPKVK